MAAVSSLPEQIAASPMAFCFGFVMFIPVAVWVVSLIHWMIGGEVDSIVGTLGIFLALFLMGIAIRPPVQWLSPVIFVGMLLLAAVLPFVRRSMLERELRKMEMEKFERHVVALLERPDRTISRMEVARALRAWGYAGHALALAEPIKAAPARMMDAEKREIRQWEASFQPQHDKTIPCLRCGFGGDPSQLRCPRCQSSYVVMYLRRQVVMPELAKKLMLGWILGVGLMLAIPSVVMLVPPAGSLFLVPLLLLVGGYTAYRAFFATPSNAL